MKKATTSIRINDHIKGKLKEQAARVGMDVSNYIAYMVMSKEDKENQEKRAKKLLTDLLRDMQ